MMNISKEEIVKKHVPYEIEMLRETYRLLGTTPPTDRVIKNALIESFCIHARSLLDFFGNRRSNKSDDYIAADFTDNFETRINIPAALRTKLNKEIFHLTGERKVTEADQFNMSTDGKQIIHELEQEIYRFEDCLPADFKAMFKCNAPPVTSTERYSFRGSTHTASVVGQMVIVGSLESDRPGQPLF
jgi:hypothetical protein